jgi:hypothetical protein
VLRSAAAVAIAFMTLALVGLACGMGARYPRFTAESVTHVAGSYGGVAYMVSAVLFIVGTTALVAWPASTWLWYDYRDLPLPPRARLWIIVALLAAASLSVAVFWTAMRRGVRALEKLG